MLSHSMQLYIWNFRVLRECSVSIPSVEYSGEHPDKEQKKRTHEHGGNVTKNSTISTGSGQVMTTLQQHCQNWYG